MFHYLAKVVLFCSCGCIEIVFLANLYMYVYCCGKGFGQGLMVKGPFILVTLGLHDLNDLSVFRLTLTGLCGMDPARLQEMIPCLLSEPKAPYILYHIKTFWGLHGHCIRFSVRAIAFKRIQGGETF